MSFFKNCYSLFWKREIVDDNVLEPIFPLLGFIFRQVYFTKNEVKNFALVSKKFSKQFFVNSILMIDFDIKYTDIPHILKFKRIYFSKIEILDTYASNNVLHIDRFNDVSELIERYVDGIEYIQSPKVLSVLTRFITETIDKRVVSRLFDKIMNNLDKMNKDGILDKHGLKKKQIEAFLVQFLYRFIEDNNFDKLSKIIIEQKIDSDNELFSVLLFHSFNKKTDKITSQLLQSIHYNSLTISYGDSPDSIVPNPQLNIPLLTLLKDGLCSASLEIAKQLLTSRAFSGYLITYIDDNYLWRPIYEANTYLQKRLDYVIENTTVQAVIKMCIINLLSDFQ
jgi:hypothetical protein